MVSSFFMYLYLIEPALPTALEASCSAKFEASSWCALEIRNARQDARRCCVCHWFDQTGDAFMRLVMEP